LLEKSSGHLELREDPQHGIIVAGLRSIKVFILYSMLIFPVNEKIDSIFY